MRFVGDAAIRAFAVRAAIILCALMVACEREPTEPRSSTPLDAAQPPMLSIARARVIEPGDLRIPNPPAVEAWTRAGVSDPLNMAFDGVKQRVLVLDPATQGLLEMAVRPDGRADRLTMKRVDARPLGLRDPQGVTIDPGTGRLFILDGGARIVRVDPHASLGFEQPTLSPIDLAAAGIGQARGIAFDPSTGRLHVLEPAAHRLYEITSMGKVVGFRDVSEYRLQDVLAMTFGPTGDGTDDDSAQGLYIGAGGRVTELGLIQLAAAPPITVTGLLVRTTQTWQFSPPSPDPSGVTYATHLGRLLIADGEVDEMSIYAGANIFETTRAGALVRTWTTTSFSNEPVGAAYNPANRHLFLSDDNQRRVHEIDPGPDGLYRTADDLITSFSTSAFGCNDPEGLAYHVAQGALFIADGVNAQVYRVSPGANGVFNGVPPSGDDQVTSFDTQAHGLLDPEGIAYDSDFGHLFVVGKPSNLVFHFSPTGEPLRTINTSAANARKPAGLEYAPGSANPGAMTLYIVDRMVDNDSDPDENDGRMYEFSFPPFSGNALPTVTITAPPNGSSFNEGNAITFTGTASDPEDGSLTASLAWTSSIDGALGSGGSVTTSNLSIGDHTITASVTDSDGAQATATISITVNAEGSGTVQVRVTVGADDAEESATGSMSTSSSDLELVFDATNQTVGARFRGVAIPRGATITRAYVQFQADRATSGATSLTVAGEASDNAAPFSSSARISTRSRTASTVAWSPVAWTVAGQAGVNQQTPSITSVVQEIVNRPGWRSGNALAIIITGTGMRAAESFEGLPAGAPLLRVDYTTVPNTAPTATNVTISGTARVGEVLTGNYTYSDAEGDLEGASTYRWLRGGVAIGGATARTYTLVAADEGAMIGFEVVPVATTGTTPGAAAQSAAVGPVTAPPPNAAPTASNVTISGTPQVGQVLTGNYTYADADGDPQGTSTYRWLRGEVAISGATAQTYTLVAADQGTMISFEVTPVAATGASPGATVQSAEVGPVASPNSAPVASNVTISGTAQVGQMLTGNYTYSDAEGDAEGTSTYRWLRGGAPISGATAQTYTLVAADNGAMIRFEVRPVATTGTSPGAAVQSPEVGPVAGNGAGGVVQVRIAARADDAEESASGSVSTGSSDLELVFDGSDQLVGLRFPGVAIPPGATVTTAYVQFQTDRATSTATSLTIRGQAADNPVVFSSSAKISTRTRTASAVSWSPAPWTTAGQAGPAQQTPDLASIIQEIVSRPGWVSGNALVIIINGTGQRAAQSFDGLPAGAPLLRVEYTQ